jgi:hypothetical protein
MQPDIPLKCPMTWEEIIVAQRESKDRRIADLEQKLAVCVEALEFLMEHNELRDDDDVKLYGICQRALETANG